MSDPPLSDPSKIPPEPSAHDDQPGDDGQRSGVNLTRAQMQAILESASQNIGPYPINLGQAQGVPAAVLASLANTMQIQTRIWQGQLPPPEAMEQYERILPGAFDRLLRMAEKQQDGQIENIAQAQRYASSDVKRGHYLGFSLSALAMIAAAWFVR